MTIASELTTLINTKSSIKSAITAKGVSVSDSDSFASYANKISQISTGTPINNQNKTVTSNGSYSADSGYTGLGTVTVNVPSIAQLYKRGNVTISNTGIASNFNGDYLEFPFWVRDENWELVICAKSDDVSYSRSLCSVLGPKKGDLCFIPFVFWRDGSALKIGYNDNGNWQDYDCNFSITANSYFYIKMVCNFAYNYANIYTSTDGTNYTDSGLSLNAFKSMNGELLLGTSYEGESAHWLGSIDLAKSYLKIGADIFNFG